MTGLRSPYPYFGGKKKVADVVWRALGHDVANFIDPFFGSNAILLSRPGGPGKIETINDADRMVANFWRAIKADPWAVAAWCDDPVNEADLHARHRWLVQQLVPGAEFLDKMHSDPDYYDAKIAGWWCWGICQWIGGGWCVIPNSGSGARRGRPRPNLNSGQGVHAHGKERNLEAATRAHLSSDMGVFKQQLPDLAVPARALETGRGVHVPPDKLPMLAVKADGACAGRGIHSDAAVEAHLPALGNDRGINGVNAPRGTLLYAMSELTVPDAPPCFAWFLALALRLRRVRVACGDWKRVLGDSVLGKGKNVGGRRPCAVFLDPPYPDADGNRDPYLYSHDDGQVFYAVRDWAIEHGDDPDLRIAVCGYADDFKWPSGWVEHKWRAGRGYAKKSNDNRERERVWFSPHCLPIEPEPQPTLW